MNSVQSFGLQKPDIVLRVSLETVPFVENMKHCNVYPPPCAEIPKFRVRGNIAFVNIGTNLAGLLFTRYTLKDTSFLKVWIVIFTCSLSRAIHLELVENSPTEQFLSVFRRFISRRGEHPSSFLVLMHQT